jgi:hypothetical protein
MEGYPHFGGVRVSSDVDIERDLLLVLTTDSII